MLQCNIPVLKSIGLTDFKILRPNVNSLIVEGQLSLFEKKWKGKVEYLKNSNGMSLVFGVEGTIYLKDIFPGLSEQLNVPMRKVSIGLSVGKNKKSDKSDEEEEKELPPGKLTFSASLGFPQSVLRALGKSSNDEINMSGYFLCEGIDINLKKIVDLQLKGTIVNIQSGILYDNLSRNFNIQKLKARINFTKNLIDDKEVWSSHWKLEAHTTLKSSVLGNPLQAIVKVSLDEENEKFLATIIVEEWKEPFNLKDCSIENLEGVCLLSKEESKTSLSGSLNVGERVITIDGYVKNDETWFEGSITEFSLNDLITLYNNMFNCKLPQSQTDIILKNSKLTLHKQQKGILDKTFRGAKEEEITFKTTCYIPGTMIPEFSIDLLLNQDGIIGHSSFVSIELKNCILRDVKIDFDLPKSQNKSTDYIKLKGLAELLVLPGINVDFQARIQSELTKSESSQVSNEKKNNFIMYASMQESNISKLIPSLSNTFVKDLIISELMVTVANSPGSLSISQDETLSVKEGLTLVAAVNNTDKAINSILHNISVAVKPTDDKNGQVKLSVWVKDKENYTIDFQIPTFDVEIGKFIKLSNLNFKLPNNSNVATASISEIEFTDALFSLALSSYKIECFATLKINNESISGRAFKSSIKNMFGYHFLNMDSVSIDFSKKKGSKEYSANWSGNLTLYDSVFGFKGSITNEKAEIVVDLPQFDNNTLLKCYLALYGVHLKTVKPQLVYSNTKLTIIHDFTEKSTTVTVSSNLAIPSLNMKDIALSLEITKEQVQGTVDLQPIDLPLVTINDVKLTLNLYSSETKKENLIGMIGQANFKLPGNKQLNQMVAIRFEGKNYLIYTMSKSDNFKKLSDAFPVMKGSSLDGLEFKQFQLLYSTYRTSHPLEEINVKKGIQIIGDLELSIDTLLKSCNAPDIQVLFPGFDSKVAIPIRLTAFGETVSTMELGVSLPSLKVDLGENISCNPLELILPLNPMSAQARVQFQIIIKMDPNPLTLTASLGIDKGQVTVAGSMEGDWIEPFGLKNVIVSDVALQMCFIPGALPSGFGFTGKLKISDIIDTQAGFSILESFMSFKHNRLSSSDFFKLASLVLNTKFDTKSVPDIWKLEKIDFYTAALPVTIGVFKFEPGFHFKSYFEIFGIKGYVSTSMDMESGFKMRGILQSCKLGALKLGCVPSEYTELYLKDEGSEYFTPENIGPMVDMSVDKTRANFYLNSSIILYDIQLDVMISVQPTLLDFSLDFNMWNMITLMLKVKAAIPEESFSLQNLDVEIEALFTNECSDLVIQYVNQAFIDALKTFEEGFEKAKKSLQEQKNQFSADNALKLAEKDVEEENKILDNLQELMNKLSDQSVSRLKSAQSLANQSQQKFNASVQECQDQLQSVMRIQNQGVNNMIYDLMNLTKEDDDLNKLESEVNQLAQERKNVIEQLKNFGTKQQVKPVVDDSDDDSDDSDSDDSDSDDDELLLGVNVKQVKQQLSDLESKLDNTIRKMQEDLKELENSRKPSAAQKPKNSLNNIIHQSVNELSDVLKQNNVNFDKFVKAWTQLKSNQNELYNVMKKDMKEMKERARKLDEHTAKIISLAKKSNIYSKNYSNLLKYQFENSIASLGISIAEACVNVAQNITKDVLEGLRMIVTTLLKSFGITYMEAKAIVKCQEKDFRFRLKMRGYISYNNKRTDWGFEFDLDFRKWNEMIVQFFKYLLNEFCKLTGIKNPFG